MEKDVFVTLCARTVVVWTLLVGTTLRADRISTPFGGDEGRLAVRPNGSAAKIEHNLRRLQDQVRAEPRATRGPRHVPGVCEVRQDDAIQVYVCLHQAGGDELTQLQQAGVVVEVAELEHFKAVQTWLTPAQVDQVALLPFVRQIRLPGYPVRNTGAVTSEGDVIHKASAVRSATPFIGASVTVGVISDGANQRNASAATGDLPAIGSPPNVTADVQTNPLYLGNGNEGSAMMEIVHDLAPGAALAFAGPTTSIEMLQVMNWLAFTADCDIVVDDLSFYDQHFFSDGPIAAAAEAIANAGKLYVTSAGNRGNREHYQGWYSAVSLGSFPWWSGPVTSHSFPGSGNPDGMMSVTLPAQRLVNGVPTPHTVTFYLQWDDAWGASSNDFDLVLLDTAGNVLASSRTIQGGSQNPFEFIIAQNTTNAPIQVNLVIQAVNVASLVSQLEVFATSASASGFFNEYWSPVDSIFGHAAVTNVVSVAAMDQAAAGSLTLESFSSQGPSSLTLQLPRNTPFITGIDGVVVTGSGGFGTGTCPSTTGQCRFFGTSAAAPHIAAIAALYKSAKPLAMREEIMDALKNSATDVGAFGYDNAAGYGLANAQVALDLAIFGANLTWTAQCSGNDWNTCCSDPLEPSHYKDNWGREWVDTGGCIATTDGDRCFIGDYDVTLTGTAEFEALRAHGVFTMEPNSLLSIFDDQADFMNEFRWNGGVLFGASGSSHEDVNIAASASAIIDGAADHNLVTMTLNNAGTTSWRSIGLIGMSAASISNTGTFILENTQTMNWFGGTSSFNNSGVVLKPVLGGHTTIQPPFNNTGLVKLEDGVLSLQGGESSGVFELLNTSELWFEASTSTLLGTPQFKGPGFARLAGGALDVLGDATSENFGINGGSLHVDGSLVVSNLFDFTGGIVASGTGEIGTGSVSELKIHGDDPKHIFGHLVHKGILGSWKDPGVIFIGDQGIFENQGILDIETDSEIQWPGGNALLLNTGSITKINTGGFTTIGAPVNNVSPGTISARSGILRMTAGGMSSGHFHTLQPGVLEFAGSTHSLIGTPSFTGNGFARVTGGICAIDGDATATNFAVDPNGSLGGTGSIQASDVFEFIGGVIANPNAGTSSTGKLRIAGHEDKTIGNGSLVHRGPEGSWQGMGSLLMSSGKFENRGSFDIMNDTNVVWAGGSATVDNFGTLRKSMALGTTTIYAPFSNHAGAIVKATSGLVQLAGGGTSTGTFESASPGRVDFLNGQHTLTGNVVFAGTGPVLISGGQVDVQGSLAANQLEITGGLLGGSGQANVTGTLTWRSGTLGGTLQAEMAPGSTLLIDSLGSVTLQTTLVHRGSGTWQGGDFNFADGGVFENRGLFEIKTGSSSLHLSGTALFNNVGTLRKLSIPDTTTIGPPATNTGLIEVQAGSLVFSGGLTQTTGQTKLAGGNIGGSEFDLQGGALTGSGLAGLNVTNAALVSPGNSIGQIAMSGYTQKPAGKLRIELSGTGPGNYDVLAIGGNAQLDGQLEIVPLNFNPQPGQQFTIISASGAVTGTFASVTGGGEYTAIYNQNSVVVQVVAPLCMDYAVPDLDHDCDVDATDLQTLQACHSGPAIAYAPGCSDRDFDHDNDVDQCDFGVWQRCFTGPGVAAIPSCDQL